MRLWDQTLVLGLFIFTLTQVAQSRHHEKDERLAELKRKLNMKTGSKVRRSKPNSLSLALPKTMASMSHVKSELTMIGGQPLEPAGGRTSTVLDEVSQQKLKNAIQWVIGKRNRDWGWGQDTAHTVLALALANSSWFAEDNLQSQLVTKQFEMDLVLRLWKHKETPFTTGHLALNIMTLVALCRDPRAFYSKDLVALLEREEGTVDFEVAFSQLAICTAGKHIRKSRVRKLLDITADQKRIHSVDTLSVVILALQCAQRQRHHDLQRFIDDALSVLLNHQRKDGSFTGNLHSTSLAVQALAASHLGGSWNATRAQEYVMSHQRQDGSFGNLFDTNAVLPLLSGHSMLDASRPVCHHEPESELDVMDAKVDKYIGVTIDPPVINSFVMENSSQAPPVTTITPPIKEMINVTYIIWVGNEAMQNYNMTLTVPAHTNFLTIMKMAAERDDRYEFSASKWANGYYVHTLAGQKEQKVGYWFWLLYRFTVPPVPGVKPANSFVTATGVAETYPDDGDYMLFWYHKI